MTSLYEFVAINLCALVTYIVAYQFIAVSHDSVRLSYLCIVHITTRSYHANGIKQLLHGRGKHDE